MPPDDDTIRPELAELRARTAATLDAAQQPEAVARRHARHRTARENIADLVDDGSFVEYGALALAAQHARMSVPELVAASPADGLITGIGTIGGARIMVLAYDYTVFAGTQGGMGHKKLDRMLELAARWRLPVVIFAEGGGGRPNDTDMPLVAGLDTPSFYRFAALAGIAPRIAIVAGRCFAGNAVLAGLADVVIATESSSIGMGGPAMIEGGGLGVFKPEAVGPIDMQARGGVVDVRVPDEAAAVAVAKQCIGYFGSAQPAAWTCADQVALRTLVPAERRRAFKIRPIIDTLADTGSVLELRREFGIAMVTALARIEGRAVGVIANSSQTLGGAIDTDASDKAARFLQLCDAFGLPVISLCDTPGFMVGPDAESTGLVRHASRMFAIAARMRVPVFGVVLRRGSGLGAQAMTAGHFHPPAFTVAWPTGEFGAMGIEGAVRLGMKKQIEADRRRRLRATHSVRRRSHRGERARQGRSAWRPTSRSTASSIRPTRGGWHRARAADVHAGRAARAALARHVVTKFTRVAIRNRPVGDRRHRVPSVGGMTKTCFALLALVGCVPPVAKRPAPTKADVDLMLIAEPGRLLEPTPRAVLVHVLLRAVGHDRDHTARRRRDIRRTALRARARRFREPARLRRPSPTDSSRRSCSAARMGPAASASSRARLFRKASASRADQGDGDRARTRYGLLELDVAGGPAHSQLGAGRERKLDAEQGRARAAVAGVFARKSIHGVLACQSASTLRFLSARAISALRPPTDLAQFNASR